MRPAGMPPPPEPEVLRQLALRAIPEERHRWRVRKTRSRSQVVAKDAEDAESPAQQARRPSSSGTWQRTHAFHLVVATEPIGAQRLLVARWRHERYGRVLAEGLVAGEHLPTDEVAFVSSWGSSRRSAVRHPASPEDACLGVLSSRDFAEGPLYRRGIRGRRFTYAKGARAGQESLARGANLIAHNAAFVLSRFSRYAGVARDGVYRGGFSMALAGRAAEEPGDRPWIDPPGYPRLLARQLNPAVTVLNWAADRLMADDGVLPGRILDLAHLGGAFAGTSQPSFADLCVLYGVEDPGPQPNHLSVDLLTWLEARLSAEVALYDAIASEVDAWRECGARRLRPPWLYSSGGLASQVLESAGYVSPRKLATLPPEVAGAFAASFYGGRTEASLLRSPTPTVVLDFSSNFVTVASVLGIDELCHAQRIVPEDVTDELATFLHDLEADPDPVATLLDPVIWRHFGCTVAMTMPAGEWLASRALIGPGEVSVSCSPLRSLVALPYCWGDLAAALVRGGRAPSVERAWRLVPEGSLPLRPVAIPGTSVVLGADEDVFVAILRARAELHDAVGGKASDTVQRRREAAVKRLGNAAAFGNLSRFDRDRALLDAEPTTIVDPWGATFPSRQSWSEEAGPWAFPPAAAAVTAGARLVVALGERVVRDAGGIVAAVHTDSLMIPASPEGGFWPAAGAPLRTEHGDEAIRLLAWQELDELFAPFDALRLDGARAWKPEHETRNRLLHVTLFGPNRYIVHDPATGEVVHGAESHLGGTLLDPSGSGDVLLPDGRRAWVAQVHEAIVAGKSLPSYTERPAVSMWRAATCEQLEWLRHELPNAQPFTSFLLAHRGPAMRIARAPSQLGEAEQNGDTASPIAPFDPDPAHWTDLPWRRRDGTPVVFVTPEQVRQGFALGSTSFEPASVADAVSRWKTGRDAGAAPCRNVATSGDDERRFAGLYRRRPVEASDSPVLIGREGDRLIEVERQVLSDPDERLTVFTGRGSFVGDVQADRARTLARHFRGDLLDAKFPPSTLRAFLGGRELQPGNATRLLRVLDALVVDLLLRAGVDGELVAESPRAVRYEMAGRLLDDEAVVDPSGKLAARCALPGCRRPRRLSYAYCSRDHERQAAGHAATRCAYPRCELPPARPRAKYCSEAHRGAMADRRRRARRKAAQTTEADQASTDAASTEEDAP